jgi:poly-beta-hydroxyalkanoate depolymerase
MENFLTGLETISFKRTAVFYEVSEYVGRQYWKPQYKLNAYSVNRV